jgi:hypothetical protein
MPSMFPNSIFLPGRVSTTRDFLPLLMSPQVASAAPKKVNRNNVPRVSFQLAPTLLMPVLCGTYFFQVEQKDIRVLYGATRARLVAPERDTSEKTNRDRKLFPLFSHLNKRRKKIKNCAFPHPFPFPIFALV